MVTIGAVGVTLVGTIMLIFDVVVSRQAGVVAGGAALAVVVIAWWALPLGARRSAARD